MSNYTTELRFWLETLAGNNASQDGDKVGAIVKAARPYVFDNDLPDWSGNYNESLEEKILLHYYTREIGYETTSLFRLKLNQKLREILPYYNQLYQSETIKFNPLINVNYTTDHEGVFDGNIDTTGHKDETGGTVTTYDHTLHTDNVKGEVEKTATDETKTDNYTDTYERDETDKLTLNDDSTVTHGKTDTRTYNSEVETTTQETPADHWKMFSDTPQGSLSGARDESYLSTVQHDTDSSGVVSRSMGGGHTDAEGGNTKTENRGNDTNKISIDDNATHNETATIDNDVNRQLNTDTDIDTIVKDETKFNRDLDTDTTGNTKTDNKDTYHDKRYGKSYNMTYSKMLMEYRDTFLNIDMMIIRELESLFLQLW